MKRALKLTYDGSLLSGRQRQKNAPPVQQTLEETWHGLFGELIRTTGASRTDAGVHARGQIVMFDTARTLTDDQVRLAVNSRLPEGLAVVTAVAVPDSFHARYGARGKLYTYRLETGPVRPVLEPHMTAHKPADVDLVRIQKALSLLEGQRDFTALMDQGSPTRRPVRRIVSASADATGSRICFRIKGDGFLYHMVRIIVGTVLLAGTGRLELDAMCRLIEAKQRIGLGPTMPAHGLCLERVYYDRPLFGDDGISSLLAGR